MRSSEFSGTDRYRIVRRLGQGSMGVVYEAHDRVRNERVALKTFRTSDSDSLYRLKREFRRLVDLDHPNLVALHDLVVSERASFFTMELVVGVDFGAYCRPEKQIAQPAFASLLTGSVAELDNDAPTERVSGRPAQYDELRVRRVLPQLVEGVQALHAAGKLHRDIKPSNVLVTGAGQVKLLDFGLAVDMQAIDDESLLGGIVGTVAYMSPEQAAGETDLSAASDWYSVGVLLYNALTGRLPFSGEAWKMVLAKQERPAPPPRQVVPSVPEDLDALCVQLLKRRPQERPSADEVLERLGLGSNPPETAYSSSSVRASAERFIGRSQQLDQLAQAIESTQSGEAVAVLVRGTSGMGKSALIREFLARCRRKHDDLIVLEGRCFERETVPYQAMDNLIDDFSRVWHRMPDGEAAALLPLDIAPLVRLFPVLGRIAAIAQSPPGVEVDDPQERRTRGFAALREVFQRLSRRHTVILFLDDMQWVDADTVTLLIDILRRPEPPSVLLLLAARTESRMNGRLDTLMADLGPTATELALGSLSLPEATEMAKSLLGSQDFGLAEQIATEASGSPFFIAELARHAVAAGPQASKVAVHDVIQQRLDELTDTSRTLLELLALSGEPLSVAVATTAAGVPAARRDATVRSLRRRSLLRKARRGEREAIEIYHDRIARVVIAKLPDTTVAEHHRALAIALRQYDEGTSAQMARHWGAAGDHVRAAEFTLRAAGEASAALAFDRAAAFYMTALEIGTFRDQERQSIGLALATTLARAARGPEAAELYTEIARQADPSTRLLCEKRAAHQWLISGHVERGLSAVSRLLAELGVSLPRSAWRALLSIVYNRLVLRVFGMRWTERLRAELTESEVTRLDVYRAVAHGIGLVDPIRGADFQARLLRLTLRAGEPIRVARAFLSEANYRSTQGPKNRPLVQSLLTQGRQIADRVGESYLIAFTFGSEGFVHYYFSEFRLALELLTRSDELFTEKTVEAIWERNTIRLVRLWALMRMARFGELRSLYDRYVREAARGGDRYTETTLRRSVNRVWLAAGDVDGARADLQRSNWAPPDNRFHLQHWYSIRSVGELGLYEGSKNAVSARSSGFRELDRSMLTRVQFIRTEARWLKARLLLAERSGPTEADRLGARLRRESVGYARVWGLLTQAAAAQQRGNDERAALLLREAVTTGAEQEMHLCSQAARHRLGHVLGGSIGAELVAEADRKLATMGIANPPAMLNVVAPGFS